MYLVWINKKTFLYKNWFTHWIFFILPKDKPIAFNFNNNFRWPIYLVNWNLAAVVGLAFWHISNDVCFVVQHVTLLKIDLTETWRIFNTYRQLLVVVIIIVIMCNSVAACDTYTPETVRRTIRLLCFCRGRKHSYWYIIIIIIL